MSIRLGIGTGKVPILHQPLFCSNMNRFLLISFVALSSLIGATSVHGQDKILLQQATGSRIPLNGYVEDYTGRELLLRIRPSEPVRRYARSEIVEVTTEYTPRHEKGRRLYASGKIAEAKVELNAALGEEDRPWVRREILAQLVKCALWTGDYHAAIVRFISIVASDPETFHYSLIPLNWTSDEPPANVRSEAREWIASESKPVSKLIGASWLLTSRDSAVEAETMIRRLARDADVRIQRLAQMQLWRLKLRKAEMVEPTEIAHWEKFAEELPIELRGGSYFVIGEGWKNRKENERAARAYLWLPLVFDSDRWLSSRACYEAAEALNRLGDGSQAANLYSEAVFRFGDTPWGAKAEPAWKATQPAPVADKK